jgi:hypothetical protein
MRRLLALLLLMLAPGLAHAGSSPMRQYVAGEPLPADPNVAYVLYRSDPHANLHTLMVDTSAEFVFVAADALRPDAAPGDRKQVNVFKPGLGKAYESSPDVRFILVSLPPGRYVLAGLATRDWGRVMGTCLCMGTVSFEARAGVVMDLGYLFGDLDGFVPRVPEIPPPPYDLKTWEGYPPPMVAAVRPAAPGMPLPAALKGATVVPADYRAFGKFPNFFRGSINRLTPLKGVLDYDADRVVDLKATP